jgi:hypothetical protein
MDEKIKTWMDKKVLQIYTFLPLCDSRDQDISNKKNKYLYRA